MTDQPSSVSATEFDRRIIAPDQFVADTEAFIDVRLPGSVGKASYSFIGPGVSQNADQVVNLTEPHGFNVGAATMPHGTVNNPHMHYTAEVFVCTKGEWEIQVGQHGEQKFTIGPDTVFSAPTWVFRGFKNLGADDGWLFAVLGGDNTGGVLWAPQILEAAADGGMRLTTDYAVVDTNDASTPDDEKHEFVRPVEQGRLNELDDYTADELADYVVTSDRLAWSKAALLSSVVPGHDSALAPVIGFGLSEDRRSRPQITNPHGFTIEWLKVEPGAQTGFHRIADTQVVLPIDGSWKIELNEEADRLSRTIENGSVVSIPVGSWRNFVNDGDAPARCLVVCGGDGRTQIDWDPTLIAAAAQRGWSHDASGFIAATDLLGRPPQPQ